MKPAAIYVLLGGLTGPDGYADSRGMIDLAARLRQFARVETYPWSDEMIAAQHIRALPADQVVIVIGYSGGGSRATWLAGQIYPRKINLLVAYDPSPWWQMTPLRDNVEKAICYHNQAPLMFGLGGAYLSGHPEHIENVEIAEQHLAVDYDESLHQKTIEAVKAAVA